MRKSLKKAFTTMELGITLGVVTLVVIAAVTLFGKNITAMVQSGGMNNALTKNDEKIAYSSMNRDYKKSQIDVQITGAQGLEMLRKKANNKALEIVSSPFANSNPDANSLAYLAKAVEIISGEQHYCAYMPKNTDKHCDDAKLAYAYNVSISGSALNVVRKTDSEAINIKTTENLSSITSGYSIPVNAEGYPTLSTDEKYTMLLDMTKRAKGIVRDDCLLLNIREEQTKETAKGGAQDSGTSQRTNAQSILLKLYNAITENYNTTAEYSTAEGKIITRSTKQGKLTEAGDLITNSEYAEFMVWYEKTNNAIKESSNDAEALVELTNALTDSSILAMVQKDTIGNSAAVLNDEFAKVGQDTKFVEKDENAGFRHMNENYPEESAKLAEACAKLFAACPALHSLEKALEPVINKVGQFMERTENIPVVGPVVKWGVGKAIAIAAPVVNAVTTVVTAVQPVVSAATSFVKSVASTVNSGVKSVAKAVSSGIKKLFRW